MAKQVKTREELAALETRPGILRFCLGDLDRVWVPFDLFGIGRDEFRVVSGKEADKLGFCRQGIEPVMAVAVNAAQAWLIAHKLGRSRWAFEPAAG